MNLARTDRALTAWMLFASVLFSLFACGLHHGQMSGQSLSGLSGVFCSTEAADIIAGTGTECIFRYVTEFGIKMFTHD